MLLSRTKENSLLHEGNIMGVEIGGTKLQMLLHHVSGQMLARERFDVDSGKGAHGILSQIEIGIRNIQAKYPIHAVGVGFGGPIDRDSGVIKQSSHITGWSNFHLTEWIEEKAGCPAFAENDANVAALGESLKGSGLGYGSIFYVTVGSGIGGGLVKNQKLVHGRKPGESEIGLMHVDFEGTLLQDIASGWGIDKRIRSKKATFPDSVLTLAANKNPGNEARHLAVALEAGDLFAQLIYDETVKYLGWAFSHVVHLIHPDVFVIGGGVSKLGERIRKSIEEQIAKFVTPGFHPVPPVLLSALQDDVVPIGAIELAKQKITEQYKNGF